MRPQDQTDPGSPQEGTDPASAAAQERNDAPSVKPARSGEEPSFAQLGLEGGADVAAESEAQAHHPLEPGGPLEATRMREQGLGVGARELRLQRDPGGNGLGQPRVPVRDASEDEA